MRTECERSFDHGFMLSEQELRRILDWVTQQIERKTPIRRLFEIKFANGAISAPASIDEVVAQENIGSKAIRRLNITVDDGEQKPKYSVKLVFLDTMHSGLSTAREKGTGNPIEYSVSGDDRDWVFVTSSELDERIGRLRQVQFHSVGRSMIRLGFPVLAFIPLLAMMQTMKDNSSDLALEAVRSSWKSGELKDPIDAMLRIADTSSVHKKASTISYLMYPMFCFLVFMMFSPLVERAVRYLFPSYNFYWGEYIAVYDKRRARTNFLFVTGICGILVSLAASWIWTAVGHK